MTPEQYIEIVKWMKDDGVDLIDVSSGAVLLPTFMRFQATRYLSVKRLNTMQKLRQAQLA